MIEVSHLTKQYGNHLAVDDVSFTVADGQICGLLGPNGAGKSTIMNILTGYLSATSGQVTVAGHPLPEEADAAKACVGYLPEQPPLYPEMTVQEYLTFAAELKGVKKAERKEQVCRAARRTGLEAVLPRLIRSLSKGYKQRVGIAQALLGSPRLIILDEPTAALNDEESALLLELMRKFRQEGISCIFITHKLHEITAVADRITIIRDGETIETLSMHGDQVNEDRIIKGMVGREMKNRFPARENHVAEKCFEVRNWTVYQPTDETRKRIDNVSFYAKKGEVLGIAGLMGAGRTELAMSIFGRSYGTKISGTLIKDGKEITCPTVAQAIANSIGYVSEDRHRYGCIGGQSIKDNITLTSLSKFRKGLTINEFEEVRAAKHYKDVLHIKAYNVEQPVANLSGGNQQKVIFGKWALADSDILFLDEPTRGIDVGAKYEIYEQIGKIVAEGKTAIVISSDMTELIGLCDRVYVMNEGRMVGELSGEQITQENIMRCIISNAVRGEAE